MHFSGVKLPPLGSIKDRIYREFALRESKLSLKKQEMQFIIASLNCTEDANRTIIRAVWDDIANLELGFEMADTSSKLVEEHNWQNEYAAVKKLKVQITSKGSGPNGALVVTGLK